MSVAMAPGALQIQGDRQAGQDVRTQNVTAVAAIANIVKTSLGPVGLDKVPFQRCPRDRSSSTEQAVQSDSTNFLYERRCSWMISAM